MTTDDLRFAAGCGGLGLGVRKLVSSESRPSLLVSELLSDELLLEVELFSFEPADDQLGVGQVHRVVGRHPGYERVLRAVERDVRALVQVVGRVGQEPMQHPGCLGLVWKSVGDGLAGHVDLTDHTATSGQEGFDSLLDALLIGFLGQTFIFFALYFSLALSLLGIALSLSYQGCCSTIALTLFLVDDVEVVLGVESLDLFPESHSVPSD